MFGVSALCCFVLIDCVEVCTTEKGHRYGVSFAARNETNFEGRAVLCGQKRQRTRNPPLGSCTYRARELVPIPVQNGARVSCKWRIAATYTVSCLIFTNRTFRSAFRSCFAVPRIRFANCDAKPDKLFPGSQCCTATTIFATASAGTVFFPAELATYF